VLVVALPAAGDFQLAIFDEGMVKSLNLLIAKLELALDPTRNDIFVRPIQAAEPDTAQKARRTSEPIGREEI